MDLIRQRLNIHCGAVLPLVTYLCRFKNNDSELLNLEQCFTFKHTAIFKQPAFKKKKYCLYRQTRRKTEAEAVTF